MTETNGVRPTVLAVSKPVVPPWSDSSKNLVRDLVLGTADADFTVLTDGSHDFGLAHVRQRPVYASAGGLSPTLRQNAHVVRTLLTERRALQHYFFAPNTRTSRVARLLGRLHRRPMIHTICSVPRTFDGVDRILFADRNVALSHYTRDRLSEAGVRNVVYVPPSIAPLAPRTDAADVAGCRDRFGLAADAPIILFPGDYSFSRAAETVASAALRSADALPDAVWVFACRIKNPESRVVEREIKRTLASLAGQGRAVFLNHVDRILDLVTAADLVVLPAASTYAKMDLPLVLIEAMALGRPIVVPSAPPMNQLVEAGGGLAIPAEDPAALADAVVDLIRGERERETLAAEAIAAASSYAREEVAARYVALYRELL